jgi:hypothetical protein
MIFELIPGGLPYPFKHLRSVRNEALLAEKKLKMKIQSILLHHEHNSNEQLELISMLNYGHKNFIQLIFCAS